MKDLQSGSKSGQHITITLEIISEDEQDAGPVTAAEVGQETVDALRKNGYTVQPIYTGQRGGFLVEVITLLENLPGDIWSHKDILDVLSALCTIFGTIIPIAKHVLKREQKRAANDQTQKLPIKIAVEIDGAPISIEAPDLEAAEGAMKLAKRFQVSHPTIAERVTPHSNVKIKGSIPKSQPRPRR